MGCKYTIEAWDLQTHAMTKLENEFTWTTRDTGFDKSKFSTSLLDTVVFVDTVANDTRFIEKLQYMVRWNKKKTTRRHRKVAIQSCGG